MDIKLAPKEQKVFERLARRLRVPKRKSNRQVVVGMVGLVGSGVTSVARELARGIGAVVLCADDVRVLLRTERAGYDHVREIMLALTTQALARGVSVVVDSDHIDPNKCNKLKKCAKDSDVEVYFVRVTCEPDVILGRTAGDTYSSKDLFGGAGTAWKGRNRGAVVKLRELWRRTPLHYFWNSEQGGHWVKKTLGYIFAEIDTTDQKKWKSEVKRAVNRLR